ncbi:MAG: PfkB domain protein [Verrucomicrobia bacterium]|nr:PfkB domain protein [Verrucomicrobiota bacterium]
MSVPPPILTLTGNLLGERTFDFDHWEIGKTQRAARETFQVGGKGINVSKMLHRRGAPTTALCFTGGDTGAECETWLRRQGFSHRAFRGGRASRAGLVVRSGSQPETTFLGPDVAPDAASVRACAGFLNSCAAGEILAVCGSVPGWAAGDFDPLRAALARWIGRGVLAADSYGPPLAWLVDQPLALVKINAVELRTLFPDEAAPAPVEQLLREAVVRWRARNWIVTDGANPVWFCAEGGAPASIAPPEVSEVSATGSGDVLFACVLDYFFRQRKPLGQAVAAALPFAAANAAHPGIAEFPEPAARG